MHRYETRGVTQVQEGVEEKRASWGESATCRLRMLT